MSNPDIKITMIENAQAFVNNFNETYEIKHEAFENQFWGTKMALKGNENCCYSPDLLSKTKKEMEDLLSDPNILSQATEHRSKIDTIIGVDDDIANKYKDLIKTLDIIIKTCRCYTFSTPKSKLIRERTNKIESNLESERNSMTLGYYRKQEKEGNEIENDQDQKLEFVPASSVALRNLMKTSSSESIRKAAYEGLRSIGPFVLTNGFIEIIKLRNQLAKELGYTDYYDYTVSNSEGFNKDTLFEILDGLEKSTRHLMVQARDELAKRHGDEALEPWNMGYMMAGSIITKMDPYFPFSKSVENYLRSYDAMNITYCNAIMTLDLLDRKNKYSNGFCHWPKPAWVRPNGEHIPSKVNFTSLADPSAVGSGLTALTTLMHEAGHAAHFANVRQPSPLFSQERAPTSVAYAENQSMFLDSLVNDSAWRAKYAKDVNDNVIPFSIIEEDIRSTHPFKVFQLRAMLAVSYFEKALYELDDEAVTKENVEALADEIELKFQGGLSPRPLLSVPHLVSDEASCYYQGYTLAEMSVHQTREYFKNKYGYIVDNPHIGPTLASAYWKCGNSIPFLTLVKDLTGKELSGESWTKVLEENVEDYIAQEKKEYEEMIEKCKKQDHEVLENDKSGSDTNDHKQHLDLEMTVKFVDGDLLIADSDTNEGGVLGACKEFEKFVASRMNMKTEEISNESFKKRKLMK